MNGDSTKYNAGKMDAIIVTSKAVSLVQATWGAVLWHYWSSSLAHLLLVSILAFFMMANSKQYGKQRRIDEGSNESPMGGNDGGREEMIKIEGAVDKYNQSKASSKTSSNH
jgi:hypothetical protein